MKAVSALLALAGTSVAMFSAPVANLRLEDLNRKPVKLSELWKRGNAVLVLPARARNECRSTRGCMQPDVPVAIAFDAGSGDKALLIDVAEKVRQQFANVPLETVLRETATWMKAHRTYEAQCARCHGTDGGDLGYPNIKSLAGIGERYSVDEIEQRMTKTGNTDLSGLSDEDKHALAAYIATL